MQERKTRGIRMSTGMLGIFRVRGGGGGGGGGGGEKEQLNKFS